MGATGEPAHRGHERDARSVREFRAKLQNQADRLGASMLEYDGELGRWRFRVEHF